METSSYNENRISVLIDARKADAQFFGSLVQLLQKSKQDVELLCLANPDSTDRSLDEWIEKKKLVLCAINPKLTLGEQIMQMLEQATGASTLLLTETVHAINPLIQLVQAQKKTLAGVDFLIGSQKTKSKDKKPGFGWKLFQSLTRLFTPIDSRDASSGVMMGRTEKLKSLFGLSLHSANNWQELLFLAGTENLKTAEVAMPMDKFPATSILRALLQIFSLRFLFFVKAPIKHLKVEGIQWKDGNSAIYRLIYFVCFALAFVLMPFFSQDFGSTWDEKAHNDYSQLAYRYLTTFGEDTAALAEPANGGEYIRQAYRFYGEQINTISAFAYNTFGTGVYETRHLINSLYGFLGLVFVSLIAFELGSWRAAVFGILFMFFNPGWFAHSMNNPTDIPFATGFAMAIYFMVKVLKQLPTPKFSLLLWLAFGIGIGLASRVGALLLIAYFGLFLGVDWLSRLKSDSKNAMKRIVPYFKLVLIVAVLGYIFGILIWPYALDDPFRHPYQAYVKAAENSFYTNNVELFGGKRIYMLTAAPWYYVVKFLGMGNPIYLLLGFVLSIFLIGGLKKKTGLGLILMLLFMTLFPIAYAELSNLNYYNGWRHYLFILPAMVPLAAIAYDYLLGQKKLIAIVTGIILTGLFLKPMVWFIKNHPNQYVYFNELVGGLKGAYGNYETDYYSNSCRAAAEWLAKQHPHDSLVVGINNEVTTAAYWAHQINPRLNFVWTRESEEQKQYWDYLILTSRTFSKNELLNGSFPPKGTVYTVEADGVPLAAVIKREDWNMPLGYSALDHNQLDSAIYYFEKAVKYNDKDEESWRLLGFSLMSKARLDSAEIMLKKSIEIYPENFSAYSNLGLVYFNRKEFQKAIDMFAKATLYKENVSESWYFSALAYLNLGDYTHAIKQLEMAAKHNQSSPEIYYYLGKSYDATGSYKKAADAYQICLGLNQNNVNAWGELASVYNKLGQSDYANQCLEKYHALGGK